MADTNPGALARPPVLLIHGLFGQPSLLEPWVARFTAAGYECTAPALPGRDPTDERTLRVTGVRECYEAVLAARERMPVAPVVVGHSFGGLLAQKLAAATDTAALVLLASIPPGVLWPQPRPLPHLFGLLPRILAGRPVLPSAATFRAVPFSTLPPGERDRLVERMVPESGRSFRAMTFGTPATRVPRRAVRCPVLCVSGTADRNVANWQSRRLARRYGAEHQVHHGAPHWIVADSLADRVAPGVLEWLSATTGGTAISAGAAPGPRPSAARARRCLSHRARGS